MKDLRFHLREMHCWEPDFIAEVTYAELADQHKEAHEDFDNGTWPHIAYPHDHPVAL